MKQKSKRIGKGLTDKAFIDKPPLKLNVDFSEAMSILAAAANKKSQQRQLATKR